MSGFDRSKFKATPMNQLNEQHQQAEKVTNTGGSGRIQYLNLVEGKNKVRIYPAHPESMSFTYPKTVHFLETTSKDKDGNLLDKEGNKVTAENQAHVKRRPIFNARVHGGLPKDPVDEYIKFVLSQAEELFASDDASKKKYLNFLTYYKTGITAKTKWVVYADLYDQNGIPTFGRLDLPVTVKDKLNEIAAGAGSDGVLEMDPFSDPDNGRMITINYDKSQNDPRKVYSVSVDLFKSTPITDDRLEAWSKQDPLVKLFKNSYTQRDFDNAIEGLQKFDQKSNQVLTTSGFNAGYEVFASDDFLDILEEISSQVPEDPEEEFTDAGESNSFVDQSNSTPVQPKEVEEMTLDEQAQYISDNNLDVTLMPDSNTVDIAAAIRDEETLQSQQSPEESAPRRPRGNRTKGLN